MPNISPLMPDIDFAHHEVPDLHERLDEMRQHGPVVPVVYHGESVWLINSHAELSHAFLDEEHFEGAAAYRLHAAPAMGKTIQTMSGEEHRIHRALLSVPFFPRQVRSYIERIIDPTLDELLDRIEGRAEVEMVREFAQPFPFAVIARLLGLPITDEQRMLEWAVKLIDYPWDPEGALRARKEFSDYLQPLIDARRSAPGDDLLSILATAEVEGERLDDEAIMAFCRIVFPAGSDTTYKNAGSLLYAILSQPGIRAQVLESDAVREAIVSEGLRWEAPTALLPRRCTRDITLGGVPFRADSWVLFGVTGANNDPSVFADPRKFDPDRDHRRMLAFGRGQHFCLGSHLARRELEAAIKRIFERFPKMTLVPGKPVEIIGGVLRGPRELWVYPYGSPDAALNR